MLKTELWKVGQNVVLLTAGITLLGHHDHANADVEPKVVLASEYETGLPLSQYWVSEKLDGIRAIWTGHELLTRKGKRIHAPRWFIELLPDFSVEGELWAGRGLFNLVQTTVLDQTPDEKAWEQVRFMLFDIPSKDKSLSFEQRYRQLVRWVESVNADNIGYVQHDAIATEQELLALLDSVTNTGGEGLMLRRVASLYRAGRTDDLIKVKKHQDAEAKIIGYKAGTGKHQGKMGSVLVQLESGQTFYIGSGFTDEQRENPPLIGDYITYRYNGYTHSGLPRFARFIRVRQE